MSGSKHILQTPIEFLKGVGPVRAELLGKELGIRTFKDLLNFFPYKYIDRTRFFKVQEIHGDLPYIQVKGRITNLQEHGLKRKKRLTAYLQDETGRVELVWFKGINYVKRKVKDHGEYIVYGKPTGFRGKVNIAHPEVDLLTAAALNKSTELQPMYHSTEILKLRNLDNKAIGKLTKTLFNQIRTRDISETLSEEILKQNHLLSRAQAYHDIHFPKSTKHQIAASKRLKFEELFFLQLNTLVKKKQRETNTPGPIFNTLGEYFNGFYKNHLPFNLTGAQKRVIAEVRKDVLRGIQMNRLIQGDVGSGKTITAVLCMLMALDNGFQACMMAPTEILANQHYTSIAEQLYPLGIKVELLTGSVKGVKRREILERLALGDISILVGTHALIEDTVQFKNLGISIIDEQHRFGVAQRAKLHAKNSIPPHVLVMTATPIPRTLAMTLYGDLDTSVIDELPPGRKPIQTAHRFDNSRARIFSFIEKEIAKGYQTYIVYPLIEESEGMDYKDLMDGFESVERYFRPLGIHTSIVHGKMKSQDKDFEMQRFVKGETKIMVATTVIEVGVNVPNATVMLIESAERFGLSQLHQLRGRVGRGGDQSYCILITKKKLSDEAVTRMQAMVDTNDGFKIAETDLQLRGPGDMMGTQQSGLAQMSIANVTSDQDILFKSREVAIQIIENDPTLIHPNNRIIANHLAQLKKFQFDWSRIS